MIEKLDVLNNTINVFAADNNVANVAHGADTIIKINELVDAVNELQVAQDVMFNRIDILNSAICDIRNRITALDDPTYHETEPEPADKFAEQRKWIGKLCWFWDEDRDDAFCDVLGYIYESSRYPYAQTDTSEGYKCCEPVKPDDDVIYKGELND